MIGKLFGYIDEYKMYIAGAGFILTGVGQMISTYLASKTIDHDGWANIVKGYLIIAAKSAVAKTTPIAPS